MKLTKEQQQAYLDSQGTLCPVCHKAGVEVGVGSWGMFTEGTLYRVYIENKNYPDLKKVVLKHTNSFTILHGEGVYKGKAENTLVIEIFMLDKGRKLNTGGLLYDLKKAGAQQCVLMVYNAVEAMGV